MSSLSRHVSFNVTERGTWRTYWTNWRIVTSVSSWDMTSVTKRWSLPARIRSTPECTHVLPSGTKKGRASFKDCNYTDRLTRFVVNCINSSGSVQDTCTPRMFRTTLRRRNVDTSMSIATCRTQHRKIPVAQLSHQWWQKHSTPVHVLTSRLPETSKYVRQIDRWRNVKWRRNMFVQRLHVQASKLRREFLRLREHVFTVTQDHDQRIEEHLLEYELWLCVFAPHQSLRKLDEHVVSSSVSPCSLHAVCDVICCPDRLSLKRDSVWRGSPPINDTDKNGLIRVYDSVRVFSRLRYSTEYSRYLCTHVLGLFIRAYFELCQ